MCFKINFPVFLIVFLCISHGCSQKDGSNNRLSTDSFTTLSIETSFEFAQSNSVEFHFIKSMKMDQHGNILVFDMYQPSIFMFDTNGKLLQRIGKEGKGPKEFQNIGSFLLDDDNLVISDSKLLKNEVFEFIGLKYKYVHSTKMHFKNPKILGTLLGSTDKEIIVEGDIWLSPFSQDNPKENPISLISHEGNLVKDTLFSTPIYEFVIARGDISFVEGKIFGNSTKLAFDGKNRIYSIWSKNLKVNYFTMEGSKQEAFSYDLEPVRVTQADRDSALKMRPKNQRTVLARNIPDEKPIVNNLKIDDSHILWIEIMSKNLGHGWFGFNEDGKPLYHINLPRPNAMLHDIYKDNILWSYIKSGVPTIVMSKVRR